MTPREALEEILARDFTWSDYDRETATVLLDALATDGWALVPVEPTEEMKEAGYKQRSTQMASGCVPIWQAMIRAAQGGE